MKIRLFIVLWLSVFGHLANASEALRVTLSIPSLPEGPKGSLMGDKSPSIIYNDASAKTTYFYLLVTNESKDIQRIWTNGNPWGYDSLSFELKDDQGHKTAVTRPLTGFTMSIPRWWVLLPGETHVFEVRFADPEEWTDFPSLAAGERRSYSVRAVYQISKSPEAEHYGVWTGDLASNPVTVSFHKTN